MTVLQIPLSRLTCLLVLACGTWWSAASVDAQDTVSAPGSYTQGIVDTADSDELGTVYGINAYAGESVAAQDSYLSFQALKPFWLSGDGAGNAWLGFLDARLQTQSDGVAGNFGLGWRYYSADEGLVYGFSSWIDVDDTHRNTFTQAGLSAEVYGNNGELLVNGYIPFGDPSQPYDYTPLQNEPYYQGIRIMLPRYRLEESALTGFDLQVGRQLPGYYGQRFDIRGFIGYYHFGEDGGVDADGVLGRIQSQIGANVLLNLVLSHDDTFDTNFMAGIEWNLSRSFRAPEQDQGYARNRLKRFTRRNQNVVVTTRKFREGVAAIDPSTGQPYTVRHFRAAAGPGGDGSVERPYNNLVATGDVNASSPDDLLFLHADSVFDGQLATLQNDQRLLGELGTYVLDSQQLGPILMPRATGGTLAPVIQNAPGAAVTLADDTVVSGIRILNSAGPAIYGDGVAGNILVSNTIMSGSIRGIEIRNSGASMTFSNTPIGSTAAEGILLTDNSGTFSFLGTTSVDSPAGTAVSIQGNSGVVTFDELSITGQQSTAINIQGNSGTVDVQQPLTLTNGSGSLNSTIAVTDSTGNVTFNDVTIDDTHRVALGQSAVRLANNGNTTRFGNLVVNANNGSALEAASIATLEIAGGSLTAINAPAMNVNGIGDGDITLTSVSTTGGSTGLIFGTAGSFNGSFRVLGDGVTAGSGGTLSGVSNGVLLNHVHNVSLNFMNIDSTVTGVQATNASSLTLNRLALTSSSDNWIGIGITNTGAGPAGTPVVITRNSITGSGNDQLGIGITSNLGPVPNSITISGNTVSLTGLTAVGVGVSATGNSPLDGPGDITLFSTENNSVSTPSGTVFSSITNQATIFGSVEINNLLFP